MCECLSGYCWKSLELARSKRIWLTVRDDSTFDKATVERCDSYARNRLRSKKLVTELNFIFEARSFILGCVKCTKVRLWGGGVSCLKFYGEQTKETQIIRRRFECLKSYKEQTKVTKTRSSGGISCI